VSFLSKAKDFFLPSEEVSAKRRLDVFGTESKAVAGAVIVGSAAALIVAPAAIAAGGGGRAVLGAAGRAVASSSTSTKVALGVVGPAVALAVAREPTIATKSVGKYVKLQGDLANVINDPSIDAGKQLIKDNPEAAIVGGGLLALGVNKYIPWGAIFNAKNIQDQTDAIREQTEVFKDSAKKADITLPSAPVGFPTQNSNNASPLEAPPGEPLTPQTQVLGRQVTGAPRKRRSARMRADRPVRVYNRVNILNQQIDK
jgi:hypothetical protein